MTNDPNENHVGAPLHPGEYDCFDTGPPYQAIYIRLPTDEQQLAKSRRTKVKKIAKWVGVSFLIILMGLATLPLFLHWVDIVRVFWFGGIR